MLGEVALYSFVVLIITGSFLTFFYQPSMVEIEYGGTYAPLKGAQMSVAYASSLDISFEIRGGLIMRQAHHWAALLFVAATGLNMLRVFFTGAFRKPRELNWVVGFLLFIMTMAAGFTGYSLPYDLLSGTGLRIIDGMLKGIPIIGTSISSGFFGGEFPGAEVVARLYSLHIMIVPAIIIIVLIAVPLMMVIIHKHTHYSGPGRSDDNVVGYPLMPVYVVKAGGFFFIVFGVIMAIAATFTINPIWNYGPYDPSAAFCWNTAGLVYRMVRWSTKACPKRLRFQPIRLYNTNGSNDTHYNISSVPRARSAISIYRGLDNRRQKRAPCLRSSQKRTDTNSNRSSGSKILCSPMGYSINRPASDILSNEPKPSLNIYANNANHSANPSIPDYQKSMPSPTTQRQGNRPTW
jgi:hypothetical protein